jgi:glycosyltransferase involved in cell wall biosynthesis
MAAAVMHAVDNVVDGGGGGSSSGSGSTPTKQKEEPAAAAGNASARSTSCSNDDEIAWILLAKNKAFTGNSTTIGRLAQHMAAMSSSSTSSSSSSSYDSSSEQKTATEKQKQQKQAQLLQQQQQNSDCKEEATATAYPRNVRVLSTFDAAVSDKLRALLQQRQKQAQTKTRGGIIALHAYHAGNCLLPFLSCCGGGVAVTATQSDAHKRRNADVRLPPFCIVLGGTDINEMTKDAAKRAVIMCALRHAACIVSFSRAMQTLVEQLFVREKQAQAQRLQQLRERKQAVVLAHFKPIVLPPIYIIPQAIDTASLRRIAAKARNSSSTLFGKPVAAIVPHFDAKRGDTFVLLPSSIRAVKDPLFLIAAMQAQYTKATAAAAATTTARRRCHLVILGSVLDAELHATMLKRISSSPAASYAGVQYRAPVPIAQLHEAMCHPLCTGIVNCSLSEGQSATILEAQGLGVPVFARRIAGNAEIVEHGKTGWLFDSAAECVALLLQHQDVVRSVTKRAHALVQVRHSHAHEAQSYARVLQHLLQQ